MSFGPMNPDQVLYCKYKADIMNQIKDNFFKRHNYTKNSLPLQANKNTKDWKTYAK